MRLRIRLAITCKSGLQKKTIDQQFSKDERIDRSELLIVLSGINL